MLTNCADCHRALSAETRIKIVELLGKSDQLSESQVVEALKVTQPTVSHHLKILEESGIVTAVKDGRQVFYSLAADCLRAKVAGGRFYA